jgi:HD-like signal output (HDOD) protein
MVKRDGGCSGLRRGRLEILAERLAKLPALPEAALELDVLTRDPKSCVADFERVISKDPGLAAKVLRCANSALFPNRWGRVDDLRRAIVALGIRTLNSIAMGFLIQQRFERALEGSPLSHVTLWQHCITTAVGAKVTAAVKRYAEVHEAFLAGLLHDIGYSLIGALAPEDLSKLMRATSVARETPEDFESNVLGYTHQEIGYTAALRWNLPGFVCNAILHHHSPWEDEATQEVTLFVHRGDVLAAELGYKCDERLPAPRVQWEAERELDLSSGQVEEIAKVVGSEVVVAHSMFGIPLPEHAAETRDQDEAA